MKIEYTYSTTGTNQKNPFVVIDPNIQNWMFSVMQEFINDVVELSARNTELKELFDKDKDFTYGKKGVNSAIGFAAGICNKQYRGGKEDLSENMLPYVQKLFNTYIYNFYTMGTQNNWFYGKKPAPKQIEFVKMQVKFEDKLGLFETVQ